MQIIPVPCLSDNYAYLVVRGGNAAVVDPSEADPVLRAIEHANVKLSEIWLTHHHWDHVGGIEGLVDECAVRLIRGSTYDRKHDRIPRQNVAHSDGERFDFEGATVEVIENPGHTLGAISYLTEGHLFSGDTLFIAGCGRVFEGTMEMMSDSLSKLRALPPETKVWCGHEYTVNNLRFASTVEPSNDEVRDALAKASQARESGAFTVPGLIETERATNPFFRFDEPTVADGRDPVDSFSAIRQAKDAF